MTFVANPVNIILQYNFIIYDLHCKIMKNVYYMIGTDMKHIIISLTFSCRFNLPKILFSCSAFQTSHSEKRIGTYLPT